MAKTKLTERDEKVLKKVLKKPQSAGEIASKLGLNSPQSVARSLGNLRNAGLIEKSDKGYRKV